jgi:methyl-accepting chemotaxis protein
MKYWTIGKRIFFGFAVILTLFAVVAVTSFALLKQIKTHQEDVLGDALPGVTAAGQVKYLACEIQLSVMRHLTAKTPEEKKTFENDMDAQSGEIKKVLDNYEKTIARTEDRDQFNKLMAARDAYMNERGQVLELSQNSKDAEAQGLNKTTLRPLYAAYLKECDGLFEENSKFGDRSAAASEKAMSLANTMTMVLTIIGISLGVIFSIIIVKGISRVLNNVAGSLDDGSNQVVSAAGQVSASSQTLAEGASEQAASLEETSSSLEEMSSMTKRNAENALKANDLAKQARSAADTGASDMQAMSAAMEAIKVSSNDIAKIIKTIDEIAFQTNILALNAAVEAARAGEAGMGFAVVADEVRNLAQRSAQAAKETANKIEGAIGKSAQGVEISNKVAQRLNEIVTKIRQVDELVSEVAGASREQTQGITQVNTAVGQMDKVTQSNAASAEESAAAAEELNAQAVAMKESVAELLQLVGGNHQTVAVKTAVHPSPTHKTVSATKPSASIHGNGQSNGNRNGNGQSHAKPELVNAAKSRSEIPLEGDFKDF